MSRAPLIKLKEAI